MIFALFKDRQAVRMERVCEELDAVANKVFNAFVAGEHDKAADIFRSVPVERHAYMAYSVIGFYLSNDSINGQVPCITDLDDFFKFVMR